MKMNRQKGLATCALPATSILACAAVAALASAASAGTLGRLSSAHYVQKGLVLHFDGIENNGVGAAHSNDAVTWKDLSPSGNDVTFEATSATVPTDKQSGWKADGYYFNGNAYGVTGSEMNIAPNRQTTVQTVTTFVPADQLRSYPAPFGTSSDFCNLYTYGKGQNLQFKILNISGNATITPWGGRYVSAVMNQGNKYVFETALPNKTMSAGTSTTEVGNRYWRVGGAGSGGNDTAGRVMVGTVHAVRAYNRVLENEEFAWNRIIDDYRYFGIATNSLPTNAVTVATGLGGFGGSEPDGMYMPDDWTFTVGDTSVTNMVDGKGYGFAGYVLETWDAATGAWTNPVTNLQATAWTSPSGGNWPSVRITWIGKVVRGIISVPDVDAYVTDGLVLHLDGFRNAGAGAPHNASAATWAELAGGKTAAFTCVEDDSSAWTGDGYFFGGRTLAIMDKSINLPSTSVVQIACGVDPSVQRDSHPRLVGTMNTGDWLAIYLVPGSSILRYKVGDVIASEMSYATWGRSYITGICTGEKRAFFQTATPSSWSDFAKTVGSDRKVTVGGARGSNATVYYTNCFLVGEVKNVRIYDRVLEDAELEQNRAVDEARRGRFPQVTVAATPYGGSVEPPGLYEVQGEWTFSATNVVDGAGSVFVVAGYALETAQDGQWGAPVTYCGSSYTYRAGESPNQVRIKWRLVRGLRIFIR